MKDNIKQNKIPQILIYRSSQMESQETNKEVQIVDYLNETEKGQFLITLYSPFFSENQTDVIVRENRIILFITEKVYMSQSDTTYISDWHSFYPKSYTRLRNVKVLLPGDNFFLLRYFQISENFLLKIFLGKLDDN